MRLIYAVFLLFLSLVGCQKIPQRATDIDTQDVSLRHDATVEVAPTANVDKTQDKIEIPPESTIKVTQVASIPATEKTPFEPAKTETIVILPKNKGASYLKSEVKTAITGSKGFAPPKAPTPTEEANKWWTYGGIAMAALGAFFCTPWGGYNFRVGAVLAAFGIGMAVVGKFIDQIKIPAPSLFLFGFLLALGIYYGYRVRHKQIAKEPSK